MRSFATAAARKAPVGRRDFMNAVVMWAILRTAEEMGEPGLDRTTISAFFSRHRPALEIGKSLRFLRRFGLARRWKEPSGGRPVERWRAVDPKVRKKRGIQPR
jgi:hypothetical protein